MKVKATGEFKRRGVKPKELDFIPEEGKEFEVTEERFQILSGMNSYGVKFVELLEKVKKNSEKRGEKKKTTKK